LSGDGNTALLGSPTDSTSAAGAALVFTRAGATWTEQPELVGSGSVGPIAEQGSSVALSSDGGTALIGGPADNDNLGAVWPFTGSGSVWAQQGPKLVGEAPTVSMTVALAGTGSGTVTGSGIGCPSECSEALPSGSAVTLTATAATGSTFAGWSGGGCSGTGTCQPALDADTTVAATFTAFPKLSVAVTGNGSGVVRGAGISCPSTCSTSVSPGTVVTLSATFAHGSVFAGWSGGNCTGTTTCRLTLTTDTSVGAAFNQPPACTLKSQHNVSRAKRRRVRGGTLAVTIRCDQSAAIKLTATLRERHRQRSGGRATSRSFAVRPVSRSVIGNVAATVHLSFSSAALNDLSKSATGWLSLTLVVTNTNGRSQTHVRVGGIRAVE